LGKYRKNVYLRYMARVENNDLTESLRGKIGRQLVYKTYSYGTVVSRYPDMRKVKLSTRQKKSNALFAKAVAYAKGVIADPVKRKKYEAKLTSGKTVYNAALSDYMQKNR
jgi:hypothetical protein